MFCKTEEEKVLRDPVHGYIHVDYQVVWDCINSRWFQRLRRIRQLGGAYMVYHTAEHSRFGHSLGVYEIVRRMVTEIPDLKNSLSEKEKVTVMLAGLLHDIGHGPYSHAFESVTKHSHEEYGCRIIREDRELHGILEHASRGLSNDVADVISHQYTKNPLLSQIISGQLDADRMDYLLRDAYFTGTKYGEFDLERILRTIHVADNLLVVKQSGVQAVENYIMARYHMYWQVYYHPVARSFECILNHEFKRLKDLQTDKNFMDDTGIFTALVGEKELSLEEYFRLDEQTCSYAFSLMQNGKDEIAKDLASRLMNRHLFACLDSTPKNTKEIKKKLKEGNYDPRYYFGTDDVAQRPYVPYKADQNSAIWILMNDGRISELADASVIVESLTRGQIRNDNRVFFPSEIL